MGATLRLAAALLFLGAIALYTGLGTATPATLPLHGLWFLTVSVLAAGYMAINIGANDVANNMGPAVGSGALSVGWALLIAAVFEALGAVVAGGDVVTTIQAGIVTPHALSNPVQLTWVMLSALVAAALFLNAMTVTGMPVSTTHAVVGAVVGAGAMAGGWDAVRWPQLTGIVVGWVVSPLGGAAIAAAFLYLIKRTITYQADMALAASRVIPVLVAAMVGAFVTYMALKGLGRLVHVPALEAWAYGLVAAAVAYVLWRKPLAREARRVGHHKNGVNELFTWPLVFAAALLSFAHGANDVANAVGPLLAIYDSLLGVELATQTAYPFWVMAVGAAGLVVGLVLYGTRMIRMVSHEITELDRMRAYAIAMSATLTVILASQLGMPVSTTHVAIGAVFGVGFLRELLKVNHAKMEAIVRRGHQGADREEVEAYLLRFEAAPVDAKKRMLADMKARAKAQGMPERFDKKERKAFKKAYKKELVKRSVVVRIVAAWIVTVPATAVLAAVVYKAVATLLGG